MSIRLSEIKPSDDLLYGDRIVCLEYLLCKIMHNELEDLVIKIKVNETAENDMVLDFDIIDTVVIDMLPAEANVAMMQLHGLQGLN